MSPRRKLLPVLAGVGALVVLAGVALSWREIAIQYHLPRLRSDPEYVSEVIEEPEGTIVRDALRRAIATPEGAETFCCALVLDVLALWRVDGPHRFQEPKQFLVIRRGKAIWADSGGSVMDVSELGASRALRLAAFREVLLGIEQATCGLAEMAELRFRIQWTIPVDPIDRMENGSGLLVHVEKPAVDSPQTP